VPGFLLSFPARRLTLPDPPPSPLPASHRPPPRPPRPSPVVPSPFPALSSSPSPLSTRHLPLWILCLHPPGQPARPADSHPASFNCRPASPVFPHLLLLVLRVVVLAFSSPFFPFPRFLRNTSPRPPARAIAIARVSTGFSDSGEATRRCSGARLDPSSSARKAPLVPRAGT